MNDYIISLLNKEAMLSKLSGRGKKVVCNSSYGGRMNLGMIKSASMGEYGEIKICTEYAHAIAHAKFITISKTEILLINSKLITVD